MCIRDSPCSGMSLSSFQKVTFKPSFPSDHLHTYSPPSCSVYGPLVLSLILMSEPTRHLRNSYAVFCLKKTKININAYFIAPYKQHTTPTFAVNVKNHADRELEYD